MKNSKKQKKATATLTTPTITASQIQPPLPTPPITASQVQSPLPNPLIIQAPLPTPQVTASQAQSSINFVISAVYTVTFANTIYLMTVDNPEKPFSLINISWNLERVMCGIMALIMTLRYFFGNNQFIADVLQDKHRTAWQKFYHFFFIALQSIILLICSYTIRLYIDFIIGITWLFAIEVMWYFLTMLFDKNCVLPQKKDERIAFFFAEMSNLAFVAGLLLFPLIYCERDIIWLMFAFFLFLANTFIDVKKNINSYMS